MVAGILGLVGYGLAAACLYAAFVAARDYDHLDRGFKWLRKDPIIKRELIHEIVLGLSAAALFLIGTTAILGSLA